jgi:hypothetical protein
MFLEKRDRPLDGLVAEEIRRMRQTGTEESVHVVGPKRRAVSSTVVK